MNTRKWTDELAEDDSWWRPFMRNNTEEEVVIPRVDVSDDVLFRAQLLKDIPYFHELYAKYHDEEWLNIAKNLGIAAANLKRKIV